MESATLHRHYSAVNSQLYGYAIDVQQCVVHDLGRSDHWLDPGTPSTPNAPSLNQVLYPTLAKELPWNGIVPAPTKLTAAGLDKLQILSSRNWMEWMAKL